MCSSDLLRDSSGNVVSLALTLSGATHTTTSPQTRPSGLVVARTIVASGRFLTYTDVFSNPTGSAIETTAWFGGDLGSDSNTDVGGTSSGDTTVTDADTWVVTYQNDVPGCEACADPVVGTERVSATNATFTGWVQNVGSSTPFAPFQTYLSARYSLTVPAGGSATLVHRV